MPYENNDLNPEVCNVNNSTGSYFNGDILSNIFYTVSLFILRIIPFDFFSPIVICLRLKWRAEHTYINGRRLIFNGRITDLLKKNTVWNFLSIITLGIFLPFKAIKMRKWEIENTHFVGVPQENYAYENSEFVCSWYKYAGIGLLKFVITVLSFGLAYFWAYAFKEKTLTKYTFIDGRRLTFNSTSGKFFLTNLLWTLLTIITVGIYGLFLKGKILRWQIANTGVETAQAIIFCEEVAELQPVAEINKKAYLSFLLIFPDALFMVCAWLSRPVCKYGPNNAIIIIPYIFAALTIVCSIVLFMLSFKAYKNSLQIKSGKYLSVGLSVTYILLIAIGIAVFVYLIILTV